MSNLSQFLPEDDYGERHRPSPCVDTMSTERSGVRNDHEEADVVDSDSKFLHELPLVYYFHNFFELFIVCYFRFRPLEFSFPAKNSRAQNYYKSGVIRCNIQSFKTIIQL